MADNRDRLVFKIPRVIEADASGRFAIIVLAMLVVAVLVVGVVFGPSLGYRYGRAAPAPTAASLATR